MKHGIEWLNFPGRKGETWNPWGGCSKVSEGCKNCWALRQANRFKNHQEKYRGTVRNGKWTGYLNRASISSFHLPAHWRAPRAIFPCSMSDFFHEVADRWREHAWHTIYDTPQHLYLILTKRPERIPDCLPSFGKSEWPWPNVWLGASVENEDNKQRVHDLLNVRAAAYFLSLEPLLGPVDLSPFLCRDSVATSVTGEKTTFRCATRWVIVGGESGPGARPMHPSWVRKIRDQCQAAGVPFFFKQWGEWLPDMYFPNSDGLYLQTYSQIYPTYQWKLFDGMRFGRVGKKLAGRLLDGRTWEEFPK